MQSLHLLHWAYKSYMICIWALQSQEFHIHQHIFASGLHRSCQITGSGTRGVAGGVRACGCGWHNCPHCPCGCQRSQRLFICCKTIFKVIFYAIKGICHLCAKCLAIPSTRFPHAPFRSQSRREPNVHAQAKQTM